MSYWKRRAEPKCSLRCLQQGHHSKIFPNAHVLMSADHRFISLNLDGVFLLWARLTLLSPQATGQHLPIPGTQGTWPWVLSRGAPQARVSPIAVAQSLPTAFCFRRSRHKKNHLNMLLVLHVPVVPIPIVYIFKLCLFAVVCPASLIHFAIHVPYS